MASSARLPPGDVEHGPHEPGGPASRPVPLEARPALGDDPSPRRRPARGSGSSTSKAPAPGGRVAARTDRARPGRGPRGGGGRGSRPRVISAPGTRPKIALAAVRAAGSQPRGRVRGPRSRSRPTRRPSGAARGLRGPRPRPGASRRPRDRPAGRRRLGLAEGDERRPDREVQHQPRARRLRGRAAVGRRPAQGTPPRPEAQGQGRRPRPADSRPRRSPRDRRCRRRARRAGPIASRSGVARRTKTRARPYRAVRDLGRSSWRGRPGGTGESGWAGRPWRASPPTRLARRSGRPRVHPVRGRPRRPRRPPCACPVSCRGVTRTWRRSASNRTIPTGPGRSLRGRPDRADRGSRLASSRLPP